jgi:hypothetical protein
MLAWLIYESACNYVSYLQCLAASLADDVVKTPVTWHRCETFRTYLWFCTLFRPCINASSKSLVCTCTMSSGQAVKPPYAWNFGAAIVRHGSIDDDRCHSLLFSL